MAKSLTQTKSVFIARMLFALSDMDDLGGFFKSVIIAQAAIESNWGRSVLSSRYNNFFGIKAGKSWKGKTVNMKTGEVFDGKQVTINSNFVCMTAWQRASATATVYSECRDTRPSKPQPLPVSKPRPSSLPATARPLTMLVQSWRP